MTMGPLPIVLCLDTLEGDSWYYLETKESGVASGSVPTAECRGGRRRRAAVRGVKSAAAVEEVRDPGVS